MNKHATSLQLETETIGAQVDGVRLDMLEKMADGLLLQIAITVGAIVVGLLISFVMVRALTRPIASSALAVGRLADLDYKSEIPGTDRTDEIGSISSNLVSLRDKLAKADETNRKERENERAKVGIV